ncbi:MAG: hypothetical protein IPP99_22290 [Chitinophagaceae bacterium]|jgi:hypothetical protein|nr:hypothetical protein [Chitinophagaceae bacterium]
MRILLISLCLLGTAHAQIFPLENDSAFVRYQEGLPATEPFDTAQPWEKADGLYQYIVSSNDLYDLFGYNQYRHFEGFDFKKYHILGVQTCSKCQLVCRLTGQPLQCHADRCNYSWVWMVRENDRAFTLIPSLTLESDKHDTLSNAVRRNYRDTVLERPGEEKRKIWYTSAGGDCHAKFSYAVLQDKYFPVFLLKEWNFYGGCRAGGSWEFTIQFNQPDKSRQYVKRTILMDRWTRD